MPNRLIKESICSSDDINSLTMFQEIFFYRLIVNCDDYGLLDARPAILKSRLFPLRDVSHEEIKDALNALSRIGMVTQYVVDGKPYLCLNNWKKHQQVRASRSKYPKPDDGEIMHVNADDISGNQLISDDIKNNQPISNVPVIQSNPIQSESNPNTTPPKGGMGENEISPAVDFGALDELDTQKKPEKKRKGSGSDLEKVMDEAGISGEIRDALYRFVEMRKTIKKPVKTEYTLSLLIKKLNELSGDEQTKLEIINQSIRNSWQDFYALKSESKFPRMISSPEQAYRIGETGQRMTATDDHTLDGIL